ncbi:MAG TPA: hypothetical protein VFM90_00830, partial [Cyclobacteriaceae bacterium]|nr:hypothetical protein [Cyclobacteriaceae bacterium]
SYPANATFGPFTVSYESDLAVMNTPEKFMYTNSTSVKPVAMDKLNEIAGFGNSQVIQYAGKGAYFLDRLENGVWRLEVMPDAIWTEDPFTRTSPKKEVAVINWQLQPITINLNDLGENFSVTALNAGNTHQASVNEKSFDVMPGTYLLKKAGVNTKFKAGSKWEHITLSEFAAPKTTVKKTHVLHTPVNEITATKDHIVHGTVVAPDMVLPVELYVSGKGGRSEFITMQRSNAYDFTAVVPARLVQEGFLTYHIVVQDKNEKFYTYPSGIEGRPWSWDFYDDKPYTVRVVAPANPVYLFNAATDSDELSRRWIRTSSLNPLPEPGRAELEINVEKLFIPDPENTEGEKIYDYSCRYFFGNKIAGRAEDAASKQKIVLKGRSLNEKDCVVQVAVVTSDGAAFGGLLTLNPGTADYALNIQELKPVDVVTLPRPYPTFLSYYFRKNNGTLDMRKIESLQISIGPGIAENELQNRHGIAMESVRLE